MTRCGAPPKRTHAAFPSSSSKRVVIIGGGVAGLAIGWRLCQGGAAVTVLERAQAGRGATWAAAGMLAATAELGEVEGAEAELGHRASAAWPDFARAIESASGIRIAYRRQGSLMIADSAEQAQTYARRAARHNDLTLLSADAARALEPMLTEEIAAALFASEEAHVDNRALGTALARAFRRAGGSLIVNEAVLRVEMDTGRACAVRTPFGYYEADAVVLAAGAWSSLIDGLPPEAVPPIRPMKGEMLSLSPPSGVALPGHVVWGNGVYLVPRGGRLLVGATLEDAGFDTALSQAAEDWLAARAVGLMPDLRDWTIAEHWAGLRPASPDGLPLLGPTSIDNLFIASGQYRNGILFAPAVAEIVSDQILNGTLPEPAFDPRRFSRVDATAL